MGTFKPNAVCSARGLDLALYSIWSVLKIQFGSQATRQTAATPTPDPAPATARCNHPLDGKLGVCKLILILFLFWPTTIGSIGQGSQGLKLGYLWHVMYGKFFKFFYNLLKVHRIPQHGELHSGVWLWPAACVACAGNFRQSCVFPFTSRTHAESTHHSPLTHSSVASHQTSTGST